MAQQTIDIGAAPNDGNGDPLRTAFTKANENFTENYQATRGTTPTTDVAPGAADIHGGNASPQATGSNQTGADLNLSGGIGSRFFTVVDFSALAGKIITIIHTDDDGEHTNIFTEGVDWTAATSNAATASSIAAMTGEFGTFSNVGDVAYLTPAASARTLTISTDDDGNGLETVNGDDGTVSGNFGNDNTVSIELGAFAAGWDNTSTGETSATFGTNNNVTGDAAFAGGTDHVVSGRFATAFGDFNVGDGENVFVTGYRSSSHGIFGKRAHAGGTLENATPGNIQVADYPLLKRSTNATPVVLTTNAAAPSTDNQVVLRNQCSIAFDGIVSVHSTATGDAKAWTVSGLIKRGANAAATAMVSAATVTEIGTGDASLSAVVLAITSDTTNGCLLITATGIAATNLYWNGGIRAVETTFV